MRRFTPRITPTQAQRMQAEERANYELARADQSAHLHEQLHSLTAPLSADDLSSALLQIVDAHPDMTPEIIDDLANRMGRLALPERLRSMLNT